MLSNRTIWKLAFSAGRKDGDTHVFQMGISDEIIHVGIDPNREFCMWVLTDPSEPTIERYFSIVGTGGNVPYGAAHVSTWKDGPFMWHLFECD